ncbi:filamin-A-interacting protein 1-like isoform X1 [Sardina pilchardus]|uniref:filamin-A-interacting protein 1-like isoform X1 n=1 Tax=Sardina pilchardus TaxID=27697 RepID=UPI002E14E36D
MRSKSTGMDSTVNGVLVVPCGPHDISQEEDCKLHAPDKSKKLKEQQKDDAEKELSGNEKADEKPTENNHLNPGLRDLSKDDLLKLLGIMEGEVQAREDVIRVLKSQHCRGGAGALESRYGSVGPTKALQALHRDGLLLHSKGHKDDVYEKPIAAGHWKWASIASWPDGPAEQIPNLPMVHLDQLQDKHKEAYRRMLEQLLMVEKCHRRTLHELDIEKRKHADYMNKSDDFTNLLEQERERLKRLLEQEKAYQVRKDKENTKRLEKVRAELVKLKSFALMLVDERQLHLEQIDQQNQKTKELTQNLQEKELKLSEVGNQAKEDSQKVLTLETELKDTSTKLAKEHEEMTAKLTSQESQNKQLRQKVAGLTSKIEALEETNGALQKSADELQELRDKISQGEYGNSNLMAELENLRKKVLEMEGKDEEITKTETHCKELRKKLQEEECQGKELKLEVERLQVKMAELEKLEGSFSFSRDDCSQLQIALEKEQSLSKELTDELVTLKIRVKELESSELKLEKAELALKDDLIKLKSVTVVMFNERKSMAERIRSEEKKRDELSKLYKAEQEKVMEVTERLIEESKKLLKFKSELETKMSILTKERDELKSKLVIEEDMNKEISTRVCILTQKIDGVEKESGKYMLKQESGRPLDESRQDESRIKELTKEIERLKNRLKQLEVVEGDLIKTEDEYDMLEKKFKTEQDKANSLFQQVEEMKSQIAFNKAIERGETVIQEAELRQRCLAEEAKNRDLEADVLALKEKIHELMNKEDQLSQLQVDYRVLQQRFLEEEDKKKSISNEVLNLSKELEVTKRYSRALRPSTNGRRMMDVPMTSTGVQTDPVTNDTIEEDTPAVFIKKSVQEENHIMSNLRQRCLKKSTERSTVDRYPSAASDIRKSWIPWMRKKDSSHNGSDKSLQINGECSPAELTLSQKQGQPLHIRVTPDHQNSQATLQITSAPTSNIYSSTTVISNQGLQKPRITIIPTTPNITPTKNRNTESPQGPERAKSPVTITTISRAKSPESRIPCSDRSMSPVSIMSVSTSSLSDISSSPEPQEMITGRAVFKVTPEKQMVPAPIKKYACSSNIVTTEDNKIHIHLGSQFKKPSESSNHMGAIRLPAEAAEGKEISTGTVLRSPRHSSITPKAAASKVTSSITITPVCTAPARPVLSVQPVQDILSPKSGASRIPMSRGMKTGKAVLGALGISSAMKMEARADGQSMRIELKKSTISGASFLSGGKS